MASNRTEEKPKIDMPLQVLTWNINGIRAVKGKSTKELLDSLQADIICLQETKVTRDMLDEPTAIVEGYDSYFSFSRKRTGYSGTATYCSMRASPMEAEEGLTGRHSIIQEGIIKCYGNMDKYASDLDALDAEGRCIITLHQIRLPNAEVKRVAIFNVYVPRAGDKEERLQYKMKFLTLLQSRAEAFLEQKIHVIILGDLNLTHRKIDNCDPESDEDFKLRSSRIWINELLQKAERDSSLPTSDLHLAKIALPDLKGGMFSDVYRKLHSDQENAFTNWNSSTDARKTNYGRRLDYILIDIQLAHYVSCCEIMADVKGSDHCPVVVTLNCDAVPSVLSPHLCSKYMPEFKGQQQKLSSFFKTAVKQDDNHTPISLSSSPEDVEDLNSFDCKMSTTNFSSPLISQSVLKKNTKTGVTSKKLHEKRNSSTVEQNVKRVKVKQDETVIKQATLKSFFTRTSSAKKTVPADKGFQVIDNSQTKFVSDLIVHNPEVDSDISTNSSEVHSNTTLSSSDPGVCTHQSTRPLNISNAKTNHHSQYSCASAANFSQPNESTTVAPPFTSTDPSVTTIVKGTIQSWKSLLTGPLPPPLCPGHKEPCILKTVNKKGPNKSKKFYVCARPEGASGNPEYRCNFFRWYR